MTIAYAQQEDLQWLLQYDGLLSGDILSKKIQHNEILVAFSGEPAGWLRYSFFWDNIPFLNMIYVLEQYWNSTGTSHWARFCYSIGKMICGGWVINK